MNPLNPNEAGAGAGIDEPRANRKPVGGNSRLSVSSDDSNDSRAELRSDSLPKAPSNSSEEKNLSLPRDSGRNGAKGGAMSRAFSSEVLEANPISSHEKTGAIGGKIKGAAKRAMDRLKALPRKGDDKKLIVEVKKRILDMMGGIREELESAARDRGASNIHTKPGGEGAASEEKIIRLEERLVSFMTFMEQKLKSRDVKLSKEQLQDTAKALVKLSVELRETRKELAALERQPRASSSREYTSFQIKYAGILKSLDILMKGIIRDKNEGNETSWPMAAPGSPMAGRRQAAAAPAAASAGAPSAAHGRLMDEMQGKLAERARNANRKPDMSPRPQRLRKR
ncbi:putative coiled coil protein [Candidatus Ichthyocystis hellenicum]|uniref:Putative coiled coil protein n=1 Tax=Candidatus Ichthyocystis hellenicum TaxID=1561003 RepID=A0A0S4M029_9BURK|nr:hypothetical protein [Candidatus Ichthyocystis hellenicum]CUT16961.1 putative coiled coil protein [Candidatus Ichthyocystis hellenicum]